MAKRAAVNQEAEQTTVVIEVPVADPATNGYQSQKYLFDQLHITNLTYRQKIVMQRLYAGLRRDNVEIKPLKPVASQADGIRWLLDSVADSIGLE